MANLDPELKANLFKDLLKEPQKLKAEKLENNIQNFILKNINEIDFREKAGLEDDEKTLKAKHYLVITIQILQERIDELNLGLTHMDGKVYLYNGEYWEGIKEKECITFFGNAAIKMGVDLIDAKYFKFRDRLYRQFISNCTSKSVENLGLSLINFMNGTFEISEDYQKLREFRKEDFLTYQLPFEYDPEAKAPLFEKFLNQVLPDGEIHDIISEYLGSIFIKTSVLKLKKLFSSMDQDQMVRVFYSISSKH